MRFGLLVCALLLASAPVRGEPRRSPAPDKVARAHLATADRAFRQGDYRDALQHLQTAYAIDPRPEYLVVFAQVYRAMGDSQRAINACELYLSTAPKGALAGEARGLAAAARAELNKKVEVAEPRAPTPTPASEPPAPPTPLLTQTPLVAEPARPLPQARHRRLAVGLGVAAATVTVAGVVLGLGLGLGLSRGPQKISFDPGR
jgi:tetratricopeptide (TPR) repeat protein